MIDVAPDRFEELVGEALDTIPDELARYMDNVAVLVEDGVPHGRLLGLYEGVPLTKRGEWYGTGALTLPDRITIFRLPICARPHGAAGGRAGAGDGDPRDRPP